MMGKLDSWGARAIARGVCFAMVVAAVGVFSSARAHEDQEADGLIDGGGSPKTDCVVKFQTGLELNYPAAPKKARELACVDGDLSCDGDSSINGSCTFNVGACLADDLDTPECIPAGLPTGSVVLKNKSSSPDPDVTALQASIDGVIGAGLECDNPGAGGGNCMECTPAQTPFVVSLAEKKGRKKVALKATTEPVPPKNKAIKDSDKLKLRCLNCESDGAFAHIDRIVFQQGCAASSVCHAGPTPQAGLNLDSEAIGLQGVHDELVIEGPTTPGAVTLGLRRVLPSDPDLDGTSSSILVEKLRNKPNELNAAYCAPNSLPDGCMGTEMPPGVDTYSPGKVDLIKSWIAAGAPISGWPAGTSCGDPEDIYVPAEPLDPPPSGEGFQVHLPPPPGFFLNPGTEFEGCQWIEVPAEVSQTYYINRVEIRMNPGTHHLLVYQDLPDAGPPAVPTAFDPNDALCNDQFGLKQSFTGSQDPEFEQLMPNGVSFPVQPGQVFGINTHYTNSYNVPIYPEIWINFWGSSTPTPKLQDGIFPGDITFSIPAGEEGVGNVVEYTKFGGRGCFYSLSSHAHRRNIGFKIWTSDPSAGGTLTDEQAWNVATDRIYYNTDWDHPSVLEPNPRMLLDSGDHLYFQCRWDNGGINPANVKRRCVPQFGSVCTNDFVCVTDADCGAGTLGACIDCDLEFGFLAEDEMCFLPGFFYAADPDPTPCPY